LIGIALRNLMFIIARPVRERYFAACCGLGKPFILALQIWLGTLIAATNLDLAVANGTLAKPFVRDPLLEILAERGTAHEEAYIEFLRAKGLSIVAIDRIGIDAISAGQTIDAMKAGADVITQGALQLGHWSGRADTSDELRFASTSMMWHSATRPLEQSAIMRSSSAFSFSRLSIRRSTSPSLARAIASTAPHD
jgi:hypothetical protein